MAKVNLERREQRISAHKHALSELGSDAAMRAFEELTRAAAAVEAGEAAVAAAKVNVRLARARTGPTLLSLVQSAMVLFGVFAQDLADCIPEEGVQGAATTEQLARQLIVHLEGKGPLEEALRAKLLSMLQGERDENLDAARSALEEKREQLLLANLDLASAIARSIKVVRMSTSPTSPLRKLVVPSRPRAAKPAAQPEAERAAAPEANPAAAPEVAPAPALSLLRPVVGRA